MPFPGIARLWLLGCLSLIFTTLQGADPVPVDAAKIEQRKDGLYYLKGEEQPFAGSAIRFHENGNKNELETFEDGKWHGIHRGWHENGKQKYEAEWRAGLQHGLGTEWDPDGNKLGVFIFSWGELNPKKSAELTLVLAKENERRLGPEHQAVAANYKYVGEGYTAVKEHGQALLFLRKSLDIHMKAKRPVLFEIALIQNFIGNAYLSKGEHEKGVEFFRQSLSSTIKRAGVKHADTIAAYTALGHVLGNNNQHEKALEALSKSLEIQIAISSKDHIDVGRRYGIIAEIQSRKKDFDKAIEFENKKLAIVAKERGANHPELAACYGKMGFYYVGKGEFVKAHDYEKKALQIWMKERRHKEISTCLERLILLRKRLLGRTHPSIAEHLHFLGNSYMSLGDHNKAMKAFEDFFQVVSENINNKDLSKYVDASSYFIANDSLRKIHAKRGEYSAALKYLAAQTDRVKKRRGAQSITMVGLMEVQIRYLLESDNFDSALKVVQKLKPLTIKHYGEKSDRYAKLMAYLHEIHYTSNIQLALSCIKKAIQIHNDLRLEDDQLATLYLKLGDDYTRLAQFDRARGAYVNSQKIRSLLYPPESIENVYPVERLAFLQIKQGKLSDAEPVLMRVLAAKQKYYGPSHPVTAGTYGKLASLYKHMGRLDDAEYYAKLDLDIQTKLWGNHAAIVPALGMMAMIQQDKGDYGKALSNSIQATQLMMNAYGESEQTAVGLNNLAQIALDLGADIEADGLQRASIAMKRKTGDGDSLSLAISLANRAVMSDYAVQLAVRGGNTNLQKDIFKDLKEAHEIFKKSRALGTPQGITLLNNLGSTYSDREDAAQALHYYREALSYEMENVKDIESVHNSTLFLNLSQAHHALKQYEQSAYYLQLAGKCSTTPEEIKTVRSAQAALAIVKGQHNQGFKIYSGMFSDYRRVYTPLLISSTDYGAAMIKEKSARLHHHIHSAVFDLGNPDQLGTSMGVEFNAVHKNRMEAIRRYQLKDKLTVDLERTELEKDLGQKYATLKAAQTPNPRAPISEQLKMLNKAKADVLTASRALKQFSDSRLEKISGAFSGEQYRASAIAKSIPKGACFIDFVSYNKTDFSKAGWRASRGFRYGAYIIYPSEEDDGGKARVEAVDLGEAAKIDPLIGNLAAMQQGIIPSRKLDPILKSLTRHLYTPLSGKLKGVSHLIISPAGNLNLIPFELLKIGDGYLLEKHAVSYIGSGRDLVNLAKGVLVKPNLTSATGPSIVVGDPKFDLDLKTVKNEAPVSGLSKQTPGILAESNSEKLNAQADSLRFPESVRAGFKPLPNTANEARTVYSLLDGKKVLLLGEKARESRLWSVKSPPVLHIATHSYFATQKADKVPKEIDLKKDLFSSGKPLDVLQQFGSTRKTVPRSPLESCGLALAGAGNQGIKGKAYKEDGVLTGMEIALLDLSNTDLVVISSCKSSSGSVFFGEGSQSLSRAFRIAGARAVVASQWPVSDKATSQLMSDFFKNRSSGKSNLESFRSAQLKMMKSKTYKHPYFWASFTLMGDWR